MNENCYIVSCGGENAVIDPGEITEGLRHELERLEIRYILLTHGHYDHIAALPEVKRITGAPVCIHPLDVPKLKYRNKSLADIMGIDTQESVDADILLSDGDVLPLGDSEIRVMHTPGHCAGACCFVVDREIFSGDTLFCLTYGRYDFYDGDIKQLVSSIDRLMALDGEYTVHPGHNIDTTLGAERVQNRYVRLRKYIQE